MINYQPPRAIPDNITSLNDQEIFVFGSNIHGRHGGGAARFAYEHFGAEWGVGVGMTGRCYAIPTMEGDVDYVKGYVDTFLEYAEAHPELTFLVTRIGCGIAGFKDEEIAPLFIGAFRLSNVHLPKSFIGILTNPREGSVSIISTDNHVIFSIDKKGRTMTLHGVTGQVGDSFDDILFIPVEYCSDAIYNSFAAIHYSSGWTIAMLDCNCGFTELVKGAETLEHANAMLAEKMHISLNMWMPLSTVIAYYLSFGFRLC